MTDIQREAALAYARKGWPVFPCGLDKAPLTKNGFHDATTNAEIISAWWDKFPEANIGFSLGQVGLMVVDLDPGYPPEFEKSLPDTQLAQYTPRGRHLFYSLGAGETAKSGPFRGADHVDIRSHGAYVLLAPSKTANGVYRWSAQGNAAFRPDDVLRLTNSAREKHAERDVWIIEPDLPANVERAERWLENDARPAIQGFGGDSGTVGAAMMLRSLGISEDKAIDLMLWHFNYRCEPEWDDESMAIKVRNAYRFANGQPGELTPAYRAAKIRDLFEPLEKLKPASENTVKSASENTVKLADKEAALPDPNRLGRYRIADREEMDLIEPPEWLIPDCLPKGGFAMLFGPYGTFKTFVAIDMAMSIATGATFPWAGMWGKISDPGPVLFVMGEGRSHITSRIRAWEMKHWGGVRVSRELFTIIDPVPRAKDVESEDFANFLKLAITKRPGGYRLVVIDTVSRAMQGINENAQQDASKFTMQVEQMQKYLGCAVLAIHHTGRGNQERAKGAVTFDADCDTILRVDREDKSPLLTLTMTKQKDAAEWEEPRLLEAYEYTVKGVSSLAIGLPSEASLAARRVAEELEDTHSEGVLDIIETVVEKVLKSKTGIVWSQKDLAASVAHDERISIPSKDLEARWLTTLRERSGSRAATWFDPMTKRWKIK